MLYVQLDTNWPDHAKIVRAGWEAAGIHAAVMCLAKRTEEDGWVDRFVLERRFSMPSEVIDRLLDLDLLEAEDDRIRPHGWLGRNPSSEQIRRKRSDSSRAANHARWHDGPISACEKCRSSAPDLDGVRTESDGSLEVEVEVEPEGEQQQATDPDTDPADTPAGRAERFRLACATLGVRASTRPGVRNPTAVQQAVAASARKDHLQAGMAALAANPTLTADQLADLLEPAATNVVPIHQPPPITALLADLPPVDRDLNLEQIASLRHPPAS